jgi:hypothetical protein
MPFGLTGAPSSFAELTACHLHDLLSDGDIELFVDDGGAAADEFDEMMCKLIRLLDCVREKKLSLSATKSEFFVTTGVFAGASVGPDGVSPDLAKLTSIIDFLQPQDMLALSSFLGLTGHFRDLVKNYSLEEGPLWNLLEGVMIPPGCSKQVYRSTMRAYKLHGLWKEKHTQTFLRLKAILTSYPVLRSPRWDGTPFIVTTDGCKEGFAGVLAQEFETTLPSGKVVKKCHPIVFASKCHVPGKLNVVADMGS